MTVAGRWLRVSTAGQDEASQEPDLDRWIRQHGYETGPTYRVHGDSAFHGHHEPELRRAMKDMAAKNIDVLVVWKSDRIECRGAYALMGLIAEAAKAGGRIEFVTEPALNNASYPIAGPMLQAFYGAMGHHESKTKSNRASLCQRQRRTVGSFFAGEAPYGYDVVTLEDGSKTLKPNGDAPIVARIFEELAAGATFFKVARGLTADGIPTPRGRVVWPEATIAVICRNTIHRGHVQYNGQTYMTVEPTTTASNWLRANTHASARAKSRSRGSKGRPSDKLLRPVCGGCGGPMYKYGISYRCCGLGPGGGVAQRKGCGNTIPVVVLDAEVTAEFLAHDEPEIIETVQAGRDYAEEIAAVQLQVKDLDLLADDYDDVHATLVAELRRLQSLPVEPETRTTTYTGRTEGDAFCEMTDDERKAFIRNWRLVVFAARGSDGELATAPRLQVAYRGHARPVISGRSECGLQPGAGLEASHHVFADLESLAALGHRLPGLAEVSLSARPAHWLAARRREDGLWPRKPRSSAEQRRRTVQLASSALLLGKVD